MANGSQSVDCRNDEEKDIKSEKHIQKSRYDSISYFIAPNDHKFFKSEYNDLTNYMDPEIKEYLLI